MNDFIYEVTQQSWEHGDGEVRVIAGFDHEDDAQLFASAARKMYRGIEFEVRLVVELVGEPQSGKTYYAPGSQGE